jgi:hypothetical protein
VIAESVEDPIGQGAGSPQCREAMPESGMTVEDGSDDARWKVRMVPPFVDLRRNCPGSHSMMRASSHLWWRSNHPVDPECLRVEALDLGRWHWCTS